MMMKRIFLSATLALSAIIALVTLPSVPASAQVEPRFVGDWQLEPTPDQPARTLRIEKSGRYQSMSNGRVIDSGTLSASDGNWKLKSDSGQTDSGRFTVISGELRLHSGSLQGWWMRPQGGSGGTGLSGGGTAGTAGSPPGGGSAAGRAGYPGAGRAGRGYEGPPASSYSPASNQASHPSSSSNPNAPAPYFSSPAYAPSDPAYYSDPAYNSAQSQPRAGSPHNPSNANANASSGANGAPDNSGYAPHPEGQPYTPQSPAYTRQKPGYNIPGYSADMLPGRTGQYDSGPPKSGYWNTPEHLTRPSSHSPYNSSPSNSTNWQGDRDANGHPIVKAVPGDNRIEIRQGRPGAYLPKTWRQGPPELRGPNWQYDSGAQPSGRPESTWTPEQNHVTPGSASSTAPPAGEYQYPAEQRKTDFDTWSKWQQQFRGMRGPRPVPKGGYIPVMKDGAARRFYGH